MMPDGGVNKKRTRIIQTSRMKDRPWLSHDKETDKMSCLWCKENDVTDFLCERY